MYAGRTLSMSMDFKKGQIAAARLFDIIERKPDIDAQEEKGDKLVSNNNVLCTTDCDDIIYVLDFVSKF